MEQLSVKDQLEMYVVYDHPADFPDSYIIRRWKWLADFPFPVPDDHFFFQSPELDTCREMMLNLGLYNLGKNVGEDPVVVETWM